MSKTNFQDLPIEVKRELVYNAMQLTAACHALANLTREIPEVWAEKIAGKAYNDVRQMSDTKIDEVIGLIEQQRQIGYGAQRIEINFDQPKGFGK